MLTQLNLTHDQRGYTVTVSTTHQTHAGALAHFTELLARFTLDHQQAAARRAAQVAAAAAPVATTAEADEPDPPEPLPPFRFGAPGSRSPSGEEPPF